MRHNFIVLILISFNAALAQQPKFDVKFSEPLAVFFFVQNLSAHYPDNPFKNAFTASAYNQAKYKNLILRFDSLTFNYAYEFPTFPIGSKMPGLTDRLLKKNMIDCGSLEDFKFRSLGLIPNAELLELTAILEEFTPVYRELIYMPNKDKFDQQLKSLSAYIISKNIPAYFEMGLRFYGTTWDNSIPFEIVLYPLPNPKGFTAEAFINNAVSAIPTDEKDFDGMLGIMLHEIFHMIYNEQPLKIKQDVSRWFTANPSKCGNYAYWLMNEAFATVLGNGYVYRSLSGKLDTGVWYNQKYINLMAKKMYPLVTEYISKKRSLDQDFINRYIKIYEDNYSGWLNELDNLLTYRYVLTDDDRDFGLIGRNYPYASYTEEDEPITGMTIEKMSHIPITKLVIVSRIHKTALGMLKNTFAELVKWRYEPDKEFAYHVFLKDKTQLIIINRFTTSTIDLLNNTFWTDASNKPDGIRRTGK
ncbi:MAG TPA: hypothetical protein VK518_12795 [Puia sp.]|nr:hypothetical protein [Puia sp.]